MIHKVDLYSFLFTFNDIGSGDRLYRKEPEQVSLVSYRNQS